MALIIRHRDPASRRACSLGLQEGHPWIDWVAQSRRALGPFGAELLVGIMMILLISVKLGWLPASGYQPFSDDPIESLPA